MAPLTVGGLFAQLYWRRHDLNVLGDGDGIQRLTRAWLVFDGSFAVHPVRCRLDAVTLRSGPHYRYYPPGLRARAPHCFYMTPRITFTRTPGLYGMFGATPHAPPAAAHTHTLPRYHTRPYLSPGCSTWVTFLPAHGLHTSHTYPTAPPAYTTVPTPLPHTRLISQTPPFYLPVPWTVPHACHIHGPCSAGCLPHTFHTRAVTDM